MKESVRVSYLGYNELPSEVECRGIIPGVQ